MPGTQRPYRPYFYSFLSAFRPHHPLRPAATPSVAALSTAAGPQSQFQQQQQEQHQQSSSQTPSAMPPSPPASAARPIVGATHKAPASGTLATAFSPTSHAAHRQHHHHASHNHASHNHGSPTSPTAPAPGSVGQSAAASPQNYPSARHRRRGSDSSSDGGFRDARAGERWYVGGRTAAGEERFFALGVVRRERSGERASIDRMSL